MKLSEKLRDEQYTAIIGLGHKEGITRMAEHAEALEAVAEAAEEAKGYLDSPQPIIDRLWDALARLREMENG